MYTSSGNSLVALEGATGAELWRLDTSEQLSEPPVPLGDRLYVGDAGSLLVVDRVSGALIEPSRRFAGVARLEAIGSRLWSVARVAGRPDRVTMAWDPEDDALVVHDGQIVGFGEGVVYLADRDSLRLIDAASDAERATYDGLPTARLGGVAVHGGTMFQQNLTGRPHALDAFDLASGRLLRHDPRPGARTRKAVGGERRLPPVCVRPGVIATSRSTLEPSVGCDCDFLVGGEDQRVARRRGRLRG
jgi:hypothetical protein